MTKCQKCQQDRPAFCIRDLTQEAQDLLGVERACDGCITRLVRDPANALDIPDIVAL